MTDVKYGLAQESQFVFVFLRGDNVSSFHLNRILVNPPAVEDATSLW